MRKFTSHIIAIAAVAFSSLSASAMTPIFNMSIHCENDTAKITQMLQKGFEIKDKPVTEIITAYANMLLDTPYVGGTLENSEGEKLVINVDELDCMTFVETVYALTRTTLNGRYSWLDFAHNLENLRYRGGAMDGYASRLHYFSDWVIDNQHRGNVREITRDFDGIRDMVRTINFMSQNRDKYPALADSLTYEKIKSVEIGYRQHKFAYIKSTGFNNKKFVSVANSGDIIAMVTKTDNLDVAHLGLVIIDKEAKKPYIIHASLTGKKVQIEKDDLAEFLRRNRSWAGVRVFRIIK